MRKCALTCYSAHMSTGNDLRVIGCNDDVDWCQACGRQNLKKTVILQGEFIGVVHYGVCCAAQALAWSESEVRRVADEAQSAAEAAEARTAELRWSAAEVLAGLVDRDLRTESFEAGFRRWGENFARLGGAEKGWDFRGFLFGVVVSGMLP